ncbi:unnamed protein product [Prorocentrum cordatum]|uniref:EF-hand domain-containing protein n=1 Tax=Prorocentrum cordatum TaxID=2364126 RepID=A0ABN9UI83_9DINO|nr:unnamed protein product [Polarella glacialis]
MADQDGKLTIKEFTNGIRRMKGSASAKDIIDVCKQLSSSQERCYHTHQQVYAFASELRVLEQDIDTIAQDTSEVLGLFNEMFLRLQSHILRNRIARSRTSARRISAGCNAWRHQVKARPDSLTCNFPAR